MLPLYVYNSAERRLRLESVATLPNAGDVVTCEGQRYRVTAIYRHAGARAPVACVEAAQTDARAVARIKLGRR